LLIDDAIKSREQAYSAAERRSLQAWYESVAYTRLQPGTAVTKVCRAMGVSEQTYYRWKKQYGGLGVQQIRRLKLLEEENRKLKQLVADLSLDKLMLQDVLAKKL